MKPLVMIVEDNDTLRGLLAEVLLGRGWTRDEMILCLDAESADAILTFRPVDFIISDFNLGAGWTGVDLFDRWAHLYAGRFVLHTGSDPLDIPRRAGLPVIPKPCDTDALLAIIHAVLVRSPGSRVLSPEPEKQIRCGTCCCWYNDEGVCIQSQGAPLCKDRTLEVATAS